MSSLRRARRGTGATPGGAALECGACLDVAALEEIVEAGLLHKAKELLERIVSLLTKMIR